LLSALFSFIFFTKVFSVKEIIVNNNDKVAKETIINNSEIKIGSTNLFLVDKGQVSENIKKIPYIDDVIVSKKLPNKIEISVTERASSYVIKVNEDYYSIDTDGTILEKIENVDENQNIIIVLSSDLDTSNGVLDEANINKLRNVEIINQVAKSNGVNDLITRFDMSNDSNIIIDIASEGKRVYLGSFSDDMSLNVKFFWLKTLMEQEKGKTGIIYLNVDLNKNKVVFREQNF
jgi:cell division protein FtsQ